MKDFFTILLSIAAFVVSARALYVSELSPFDPKLVASDPIWRLENVSSDGVAKVALVMTILISNQGAKTGCIRDIIVSLRLPVTKDFKKLKPYYFVNTDKLFHVMKEDRPNKRRHIYEAHEATFSPIFVLGKQQVIKTIVFRHPRFRADDFKEGEYEVHLAAIECSKSSSWNYFSEFKFIVQKEELENIVGGYMTILESEDRIRSARELKPPI